MKFILYNFWPGTTLFLQNWDNENLFVLTPRVFIGYVIIAALIGALVAIRSSDKRRKIFWTWFLMSLVLTPIVGLAYLIFTFTGKSPKA